MTAMQMPEGMEERQMVSFPWSEGEKNISEALTKMKNMKPGTGGTLVYFTCDDCEVGKVRVEKAGGKVFYSKMPIGEYGLCSIISNTEGNTVCLHSMK